MHKLKEMMSTSHFKVSRHKVVEVPNKYVVSEDEKLSSHFTPYEIKKLKELVHITPYPNALIKNGLMDLCIKVCKYYNITIDDFRSSKRDRYLVIARLDFCHLVKKNNNYFATTSVGRFMNRDHTTVLYYLKKQPVNLDKINAETH